MILFLKAGNIIQRACKFPDLSLHLLNLFTKTSDMHINRTHVTRVIKSESISKLTGSTLYFASDAIFFTSAKAGIIFIRCTSKEFLHFFMQQELNYVPYAIKNVPDRNILSVKDE